MLCQLLMLLKGPTCLTLDLELISRNSTLENETERGVGTLQGY